jgi:hypothetical protein
MIFICIVRCDQSSNFGPTILSVFLREFLLGLQFHRSKKRNNIYILFFFYKYNIYTYERMKILNAFQVILTQLEFPDRKRMNYHNMVIVQRIVERLCLELRFKITPSVFFLIVVLERKKMFLFSPHFDSLK